MDPEHYQRVKRVSSQCVEDFSQGALKVVESGHFPDDVVVGALIRRGCELGERLWREVFPEGQGYGETVYLDLRQADLSGADIYGASGCFNKADFCQADLRGSRWVGCRATEVNLSYANLQKSIMRAIRCDGWCFRGADASQATIEIWMTDSDTAVDFGYANLTDTRLTIIGHASLILTGAKMTGCRVSFKPWPASDYRDDLQRARQEFLAALSEEQLSVVKVENVDRGCFIATACCGSAECSEVRVLQAFRDEVLLNSRCGRRIVSAYYCLSPPIATWLATRPKWRSVFRRLLVGSLVSLVKPFVGRDYPDRSVRSGSSI